uniref:Vitellogenin domain-containing protein n=1 Tax=Dendroctonus ponderosae TaxID=77166 RepID=A0AAR5QJT3_DENPD
MDGSGQRRVPLGIVFLVILVIGNVQSEEVCRGGCKGAAQTFKYAVGTTYQYKYDGKIEISLSSAEGQTTSTEVKADVSLTQLPECNQLLKLQNVQILGANGKKFGSIPDIEKPIRINNNDGTLDDSICVVDGDNQNSINVKRAIASIFQASLKNNYETDVFGRCPTEVSSHKEGGVLVIQKSRSLNKCSYREHIQQDFLSTALNLNSEIKSSPILNGDYSANLKVKNGILDQATVTEDYLFVPFSVGKNGAKAQIVSKLQYSGTSKTPAQSPASKPRSIIFENPHPVTAPTSNVQTILEAVKDVAKTIDVVVGEETAKEFINLLKIVKVSSASDLLAVYNQVRSGVGVGDKNAAKRLYLDALLRAGNGETIEAILQLLNSKQLDELDSKLALLSLNVVRHATEGSVKAVTHLLDTPKLPREAYLGIGNLAGRFCAQHNCDNNAEIKALTNKLLAKVGGKFTNREQENDAVYALKALANLRDLSDIVVPKVTALAQNKNLPSRLRVAALDTYLADACKDKLRNSALQILQDIQQDSEVRIRAFLVVAQCPTAKIGTAVQNVLNKEPSIQVGGFITSYIHALRASANPDKDLAKKFLGFRPTKNFPIDPRKYSFNGEFSYAVDTLGLAASSEANVIYSQNSWLPRSTNLNLTAEVFGHSLNFLEIETRQENLDRLVEHYLGPKGVLRKTVLPDLLKEGKTSYHKLADYVEGKLKATLQRSRRDVSKAEIENIAKQVQIKTSELNKDLDLDVSLKAFGSEIFFLNVNQEAKVKPEAIIDSIIAQLAKGLDRLQRFEETFRRNLNFLNAELDYPTSLGFPLRLAIDGSATVQVKAEGNVDVRKLINNPEKGELRIKLIPSANVEVAGTITLDALVVENGLKVVSTLYSSTGGDLKATWDKATGFDLKLGLPVQEQKLISVNHEIVFASREQAGKAVNLPLKFTQVKDFSICLDQLSSFIGLTFCAEINGPNVGGQQIPVLPFPLAGDAKVAVTIENDDVSEYRLRHSIKPAHADLVFETIDKQNKKKVSLDLEGEYSPEKYVRALFTSSVKTASAEARIILTNVEKSLLIKILNDQDEIVGKIGVSVSGTPERAVYKPILELKTPSGQQPLPVKAEGEVVVESSGENLKIIFQNVKVFDAQRQLTVSGNVGREAGVFFSDVKISNGAHNVGLEGRLQLTSELIKFNVKIENSINSNANFNLKGEFKKQESHYDAAIQLIHGPDLNSKSAIISVTSSLVNKFKSTSDFRFETKNSLSYPLLGVSAKFELEQTPKSLDYEINAEYGELKLGSELEAKIDEKTAGDYDVEFEIWGLENKLQLKSRRQVLPNDESKISNSLELNGKKLELDGKVRHVLRPHNIDVGADLTVHVPSHATPFKVGLGLKVNQEEIDAHAKISSGSDHVIDSFIKANKKGNANGSIKVNLKNAVTVNGQIHANNGAGSGDILIDLQNGKRQIKAETTFAIHISKSYDVTISLYPSFNKDKNVKILLSTQNKVSDTSLESNNKLDVLGHPVEVNVKASRTGDRQTGKLNGELEVTLPGDQYFLARGNCDHQQQNDLLNGQTEGSLEYRSNKNTPGRKLGLKTTWKNTNLKKKSVDVVVNLSADDSNGKNINSDLSLLISEESDATTLNSAGKLYGSILKNPVEVTVATNCKKGVTGQIEIRSSYGPDNSVTIKGNHDLSSQTKRGALTIQATTSSKHLKSLNADISGSVAHLKDLQIEGSLNVQALNAEGPLVDLKSQGNAKIATSSGEVKGTLALNKIQPIGVDLTYNINQEKQTGAVSAAVTYGNGESVKGEISGERTSENQVKLSAGLQTPVEGYRNTQLNVNARRSKDNKDLTSSLDLTIDGKVWKLDTELVLSELSPVISVKLLGANGKLHQIYAKANRVSYKQFSADLKLVNEEKSFLLDGTLSVNVENVENLVVKGQVNSPSLNLDKIVFDAHTKGSNNDNKIQISVKTAGKNYISGSFTYGAKDENGKFIIDGSGTLKVKDASKSGHFKYIFQKLEQDKNAEQGVQVSFDGALGDRAVDSEFKLTSKHFRVQNSYCEQKKECAYIEIDNKINTIEVETFNQVLEINLDLRKLGLSHEFGLKAVTNRKGWIVDHTVDAHFQNQENSKYQYSFYLRPNEGGVSLTTPKRIVSLESKTVLPKNFKQGGKGSGEIAFYLDKKNHASKKTALNWFLDVDLKGKITGEAKFNHPGLQKPLAASFKAIREGSTFNGKLDILVELNIFAQDNQKLIATFQQVVSLDDARTRGTSKIIGSLKSQGLGVNVQGSQIVSADRTSKVFSYEAKSNVNIGQTKQENVIATKWSPTEISGIVKVFDTVLIKSVNKITITDNDQIIESEVSSYNNVPVNSRLEIKNANTLSYSVSSSSEPNRKFLLNAGLIPGQVADIRGEVQDAGSKVTLFYATVKLDEVNFLKSEHKVDSKAIKANLEIVKEKLTTYLKGLEATSKEWVEGARKEVKSVGEIAKTAIPNLKPLQQYYANELQEVKQEILNDKSIKELGEVLRKILGSLITAATELFDKLSKIAEESTAILQNSFNSVIAAIENELIPEVKELGSKLLSAAKDILGTVLEMALGVAAKASQIIEKYEPELQELASSFGELFQDFGRLIYRIYENSFENITSIVKRLVSEVKSSRYLEELKIQYEKFVKQGVPSAETIINALREASNFVKDVIPVDFAVRADINALLDSIVNYVEKKLNSQQVNDVAAIEDIIRSIAAIVKKLALIIHTDDLKIPGTNLDSNSLLPLSYLKNLPRLVAVKFSPLSYILNESVSPELGKVLLSLVNKPRNLVPPFPLFGIIVQGQHIFTFDGQHLTFPGKCNYLLARDAVNGNFTLAGAYKDGLLASITLADESGSLTLLQGGKVKLNQDNVELPLRKPTLAAFRDYEIVTLVSTSGIAVECVPDLSGCVVKISGFYHGQIRGLLGNGNGEPYDDLTIPHGKIVTTESQFANAYKLSSSCPDVALPQHGAQVHENPACAKLFGWESPLRVCYPFVSTENFKTACAHGLAANVKDTEESIAKAYVAACQERNIPVHVPESLVKCTNGDKPYSVGDTFSVKLPSKSADIVLIVDTQKSNQVIYEKLIKTLIPEISNELHSKGVKDVEFHLVTYGGENQWPSHITVNGKLTFKGKPPGLKFAEDPKSEYDVSQIENQKLREAVLRLKELLHDLGLATGINLKAQTFDEATNYPFRVNALKSIIVVNGAPCEEGKFALIQRAIALSYKNSKLSLNLFTPFGSLLAKDAKKTKDIIGFSDTNVFTVSQAKKNPKGTPDLHKELNYQDYCVGFTIKNRGNAFVNDNFLALNEDGQKQFIHVAASNIVEQLINAEQGLDCECKLVNPWNAINVCSEAYIKDRPSKKV